MTMGLKGLAGPWDSGYSLDKHVVQSTNNDLLYNEGLSNSD